MSGAPDILAELRKASAASSPALAMCAAIGRGEPLADVLQSHGAISALEAALEAFARAGALPADLAPARAGLVCLADAATATFAYELLRAFYDATLLYRAQLAARLAALNTPARWVERVEALAGRASTSCDLEPLRVMLQTIHRSFDTADFVAQLGATVALLESFRLGTVQGPEIANV